MRWGFRRRKQHPVMPRTVYPVVPMTSRRTSGPMTPYRSHQSGAYRDVRGRRHVIDVEPSDVVVFLGSEVRWRPLPVWHQPSAEEGRPFRRSCGQPTQVRRRASRYVHAEFFAQFPRERVKV